jgi:hypothetical protein
MNKLDVFREKYPQYNEVPDEVLADGIYKKFYSNVPRERFDEAIFKTIEPEPTVEPDLAQPTEPDPEDQSFLRSVADVPIGFTKGAVSGVRFISDVLGADNTFSKAVKGVEEDLASLMSAQSKEDSEEISKIMKEAEDKGVGEQLRAAVEAFSVAPIDLVTNALGTAAPGIVTALGGKILGAGTLATTGILGAVGTAQGLGIVKDTIYEATKKALTEAGFPEDQIEGRAQLAQAYGGENLGLILGGGLFGGFAAVTGVDKALAKEAARKILGNALIKAESKGGLKQGAIKKYGSAILAEGVFEAAQAGQEKYAENVALQREGKALKEAGVPEDRLKAFDVPTFRGVAGAAGLEGIIGGALGAGVRKITPDEAADVELKKEVEDIGGRTVSDIKEAQKASKKKRIDEIAQEQGINKKEAAKVYKQKLEEAQKKDVEEQPELELDEVVGGGVESGVSTDIRRKTRGGDATQSETSDESGMGLTGSNVVGDRTAEARIDDSVKLSTASNTFEQALNIAKEAGKPGVFLTSEQQNFFRAAIENSTPEQKSILLKEYYAARIDEKQESATNTLARLQTEINKTRNQLRKDESDLADPVTIRDKVEFEASTEEAVIAKLEKNIQENKLKLSNLETAKDSLKQAPDSDRTAEAGIDETVEEEGGEVFFRGQSKTKKGTGAGAMGEGIYLTPSETQAKFFADQQEDGEVVKYKVKPNLKIANYKEMLSTDEVNKFRESFFNKPINKKKLKESYPQLTDEVFERFLGTLRFQPEVFPTEQRGFSKKQIADYNKGIKKVIKKLGFDGVNDPSPEIGLVIFDPKNTTEVKQEVKKEVKKAVKKAVKKEVTAGKKEETEKVGVTPEQIKAVTNEQKKQKKKAEAGESEFVNGTAQYKITTGNRNLNDKPPTPPKLPESKLLNLANVLKGGILNIMTLRQMDESLPRVLVGAGKKPIQLKFIKNAIRIAAEQIPGYRNKIMREGEPVLKILQNIIADPKLGQSEAENLQIIMKEATISEADPSTRAGRIKDPELAKAFDMLSPEAKKAYKLIRNYYIEQMKGVVADVKAGARAGLDEKLDAAVIANIDELIDKQFAQAIKIKPYFPLKRFGQFWFQVGEDSDPDKEFYTFESLSERNRFLNKRQEELTRKKSDKAITARGTAFIKDVFSQKNMQNPGFELLKQIESVVDNIRSNERIRNKELFADELKDNLHQLAYLMMPEGNFRKMFINRKGIKGASNDVLRVFSTSSMNIAYQRSRVRYSKEYNENISSAKRAVSSLVDGDQKEFIQGVVSQLDSLERRNQILGLEPTGTAQNIANALTNLGFVTFLSAPASAAINVFGMLGIGIPTAGARYGNFKIAKDVTKYIGFYAKTPIQQIPERDENGNPAVRSFVPDLGKSTELSNVQRQAYQRLIEDNVIDTSYTYDMAGLSEKPVSVYASNYEKTMRALSAMFHHSEKMNRSALAMAIFDAAYAKSNSFEFALQEAKDITYRALGDFTRPTKAPIFSTPVGKVIFQFKSYPLQMTYIMLRDFKVMTGMTNDITPKVMEQQLREDGTSEEEINQAVGEYLEQRKEFRREARGKLFGILGLTALFGGVQAGFPLYSAMAALIESMSDIDDDDDYIDDFDTWFYTWMTEEMGLNSRLASAVIRGAVGEYAGIGLSDRVSLDIIKLWFREGVNKRQAEDQIVSAIANNLGPTVSMAMSAGRSYDYLVTDGDWYKAMYNIAPAIIKGPMMSARYAEEGARTRSGEFYVKPEDITPVDLFVRSLGFAPENVLRNQKTLIKRKGAVAKVEQERNRILKRYFVESVFNKGADINPKALKKLEERRQRFNQKYFGVRQITPKDIRKSLKSRNMNLLKKELSGGVDDNFELRLNNTIKVIGEK